MKFGSLQLLTLQTVGDFCALQHTLTPLSHFTWPTTFCFPLCFHFVIIPLTIECGIFSSKEISRTDLLHR
ncbi:unnamed protein product [Staurois parvus]|uniref:Uncharacterized protein n=1 Tax=Staurois parvus TaxID=386267 RepID=A0ABN9AZ67_9NEOB|nr:unnamed protein product [Staurois parvus]